jgi:hypothetical protein
MDNNEEVEKTCTTCEHYKPIYSINPETKETETKTWCKLVNQSMMNSNPCDLYHISQVWAFIQETDHMIKTGVFY